MAKEISIHSLYAEGDYILILYISLFLQFQSTPSMQRETQLFHFHRSLFVISIHSLYAEGDVSFTNLSLVLYGISIHSLYAEGDTTEVGVNVAKLYISIHSLYAEGDQKNAERGVKMSISIHSLYAEGDCIGF